MEEPRVGRLYSCEEQSKMHGGDQRSTLPDNEGKVRLIRFKREKNPDGPDLIELGPGSFGSRVRERRVEMLRRQGVVLPVYKRIRDGAWKYLGLYRVRDIADGGPMAAERSKIVGRPIRYVIRLKEAG